MTGSVSVCPPGMEGTIPSPMRCRCRDGRRMLAGTEAPAHQKAHPVARRSCPTKSCSGMQAVTERLSWHSQGQQPELWGFLLGRHGRGISAAQRWGVNAEPHQVPRKQLLPQTHPVPFPHLCSQTMPSQTSPWLSAHRPLLCHRRLHDAMAMPRESGIFPTAAYPSFPAGGHQIHWTGCRGLRGTWPLGFLSLCCRAWP